MNYQTYASAYQTTPIPPRTKLTLRILSAILCLIDTLFICLFLFGEKDDSTARIGLLYSCAIAASIFTVITGFLYYRTLYIRWHTPQNLILEKISLTIGFFASLPILSIYEIVVLLALLLVAIPGAKRNRLAIIKSSAAGQSTTIAHVVSYTDPSPETSPNDIPVAKINPNISAAEQLESHQQHRTDTLLLIVSIVALLYTLQWVISTLKSSSTSAHPAATIFFSALIFGAPSILFGILLLVFAAIRRKTAPHRSLCTATIIISIICLFLAILPYLIMLFVS